MLIFKQNIFRVYMDTVKKPVSTFFATASWTKTHDTDSHD